jgi:hypothetical protein
VHDPTVLEPVDRVGRTHAELPAAGGHHEELNRTQFDEPEPAPAAWVRSPG